MRYVSVDPSGNYGREGMGVTGIAYFEDGEIRGLTEVKADRYDSETSYWEGVLNAIFSAEPDHIVIEGFKLYNHKKSEQVNSELQTPQLIGVIKQTAWFEVVGYSVQFASEVKTRWSDQQLLIRGILHKENGKLYWRSSLTNTHKRDAIRHGLHFWRYKYEQS